MRLTREHKYTFEVDSAATKGQIRAAANHFLKVNVLSVKTIKIAGEMKRRRGRRGLAMAPGCKKAIVELPKGQKIDFFDTGGESIEQKGQVTTKQADKPINAQKIDKGKIGGLADKVVGLVKGKGKQVATVKTKDSVVRKAGDK